MKRNLVLVFCLSASAIQAQQTNEVDALKRQLQEATEKFDRALQEHRRIIDDLNRRLQQVQTGQTNGVREQTLVTSDATNAVEADQSRLASATGPRIGTQRAYMDIGLVGTFAAGSSTASDIE